MVGLDLWKALEDTDYLEPLQSNFNLEHRMETMLIMLNDHPGSS